MSNEFLTAVRERVLVADGAMGTMLYAKGFTTNRCLDEINLSHPDVVREIHGGYIEAGADIIETNTFGANRLKLAAHGHGDRVAEINRSGVELARSAAERVARYRTVFVAGSVGPPGRPLEDRVYLTSDDIREVFREQIAALVDAGVDLLCIETISNVEEARQAVLAAKEVSAEIPIVAHVTFTEEGDTVHGQSPEQAALELVKLGAHVVGANCSVGPHDILPIIERMRKVTDSPLSVMPNAGTPRLVEGRFFYMTTPEYLANHARRLVQTAAVSIVGGCCGTTPEHIRALRAAVKSVRAGSRAEAITVTMPSPGLPREVEAVPVERKSRLARLLREKFTVSVEIKPPRGVGVEKTIEGARMLKENGVDVVNIPDGALASARVSPVAMARIIEQEVGIETIIHWCCRDKNLLGMQADLLGAYVLGQRNILAVTGDPPKLGDYPNATAVFDVDSIGLVKILNRLNHGQDLAGKPIGDPTAIHIGVGADPSARNVDEEVRRFRLKVEAGAEFVMTQPVFDVAQLRRFLDAVAEGLPPVLVGILPLTSYRNAEFYNNEIPGMHIPEDILDRMRRAGDGDEARDEGIRIAQEALVAVKGLPGVAGAYLMPPFGRYSLAVRVMGAAGR
jgi:homocysteine S-methyltransferase